MGRCRTQHGDVHFRVGVQAAAIEIRRTRRPPHIIHNGHFRMDIHRTIGDTPTGVSLVGAQRKYKQSPLACRTWTLLAQPGDATISEPASAIGMVRQHERQRDAAIKRSAHRLKHFHRLGTALTPTERIQPQVDIGPEILILDVDKSLRVGQGAQVHLANGGDSLRRETIRVRGNRARYLRQYATARRRGRCVRVHRELRRPLRAVVTGRHLFPPLRDIALDIADRSPLDERVYIVPRMRRSRPVAESLGRERGMMVCVPAVVIARVLSRQINSAKERDASIYHRALLMQRLCDMRDAAAAIVEQAIYADCGQRRALLLGIISQMAARVICVLQEHADPHATLCGKAKHFHDAQLTRDPESHCVIVQSHRTQLRDQTLLFW